MSELREAALSYAQRAWRVFPLHGVVNARCTCGRPDCSTPGKHPVVRRGLHAASIEESLITEWWRRWRRANIGVVTGVDSGIAVVDIDLPDALPHLGLIASGKYALPRTLTGLTGGGGTHLIYSLTDASLGNSAGRLPGVEEEVAGIDLRANGGYIVAPPSVHHIGANYVWLDEGRPIAPLPGWIRRPERAPLSQIAPRPAVFTGNGTAYGLHVLREELSQLRRARRGTRNHALNRAAFAIAQVSAGGELLEPHARAEVLATALTIGLPEPEALQTIESAFQGGFRRPRCAPHRAVHRR